MRAYRELKRYVKQGAMIEIKKAREKRTIKQNSYLHVLFGLFGAEFGYSLEETKTIVKRQFSDVFVYQKNGNKFLRSTSELDKEQTSEFIERFRNWSAANGLYMPSSEEYLQNWSYYDNELERSKVYS